MISQPFKTTAFAAVVALGFFAAHQGFAQNLDPAIVEKLSELSPDENARFGEKLVDVIRGGEEGSVPANTDTAETPSSEATALDKPRNLPPKTEDGRIRAFGYDVFSRSAGARLNTTNIPIPVDYVLGPGDTVQIQLFGKSNRIQKLPVSRNGEINFPELGPISVAGMRFDDFTQAIERRVSQELIGSQVSVSLGALRSIQVFVLGDVYSPGAYTVSSLATVTHALFASGGMSPVGSLRRLQLKRGGKLVREIDLYDLLLKGDSSADLRLQPGDVIFVPPVGRRVTVEGEVKRPAIYEMKGPLTVAGAFDLTGGLLASSEASTAQIERIESQGKRVLLPLNLLSETDSALQIQDGDRITVRSVAVSPQRSVGVFGPLKYPGVYPLDLNPDVRALLKRAQLDLHTAQSEPYFTLALLDRHLQRSAKRKYQAFSLATVLDDAAPSIPLVEGDRVLVFTGADIAFLNSSFVRAALSGDENALTQCGSLSALAPLVNSPRALRILQSYAGDKSLVTQRVDRTRAQSSGKLPAAHKAATEQSDAAAAQSPVCPEIFENNPQIIGQLLEQSIGVFGEVQFPGIYPVPESITLADLLEATGGLTREADPARVEYVSYQATIDTGASRYEQVSVAVDDSRLRQLIPGDSLNVRPRYLGQEAGSVLLNGEFRLPGRYTILRGETLSQLVERAGGLTEFAYPYGAVLTRDSARQLEAQSQKRAAQELQDALVTTVTSGALGSSGGGGSATDFLKLLIAQLETTRPVGRIVIEADPAILEVRPEFDIRLEPGDEITMPKRPTSVTVTGQVLSAGSVAFVPGDSAQDYIEKTGGATSYADLDHAFVVYPNGQARALELSFWNFRDESVPPGSYIVVPRDTPPVYSLFLTEKIAGIFSNLAISAAALSTISN